MVYPKRNKGNKTNDSRSDRDSSSPVAEDTPPTEKAAPTNTAPRNHQKRGKPDNKPKNTKIDIKNAPPPQPSNMSTKSTKPVNDPLAVDYLLGAEEASLMPVRTQKILGVEFSSYPDLIESTFRALCAQSSHFSKTVPPSAFALYAMWHLHYRLIMVKEATNSVLDADEDAFRTAFASAERVIPKPLATYLAGIGPFTVRDKETYWVSAIASVNEQGHFGRIDDVTAIQYATNMAPVVCVKRLIDELNAPAVPPNQGSWALPADIVPNHGPGVPAPAPNRNLLGYQPLQPIRAEARQRYQPLVNEAVVLADVPTMTRFQYIPALASDMCEQISTTFGPHENMVNASPTGSLACGVRRLYSDPPYQQAGVRRLMNSTFLVSSTDQLPETVTSAAVMFGYRVVRANVPNHADSPITWAPNHWPENWMDNKDDWLSNATDPRFQEGSRNLDMYRSVAVEPLTSITRWIAMRLQKPLAKV